MPADLNLLPTDVVLFASGTFTGGVNANTGAVVCVDGPAAFNPSGINGFAPACSCAARRRCRPCGRRVRARPSTTRARSRSWPSPTSTGTASVVNRPGATIVVESGLALPAGVTATNDGTIQVNGSVNFDGTLTTNGALIVDGVFVLGGTVTNTADMTVTGQLTVNGPGALNNGCRLSSDGLINNGDVGNAGIVDLGTGGLLDNGGATITQSPTGVIQGGDFTNNGSVLGSGQYLFTGATRNQGTVTGDPAQPIVFFDTSQTGTQIFDVEVLGTIDQRGPPAGHTPGPRPVHDRPDADDDRLDDEHDVDHAHVGDPEHRAGDQRRRAAPAVTLRRGRRRDARRAGGRPAGDRPRSRRVVAGRRPGADGGRCDGQSPRSSRRRFRRAHSASASWPSSAPRITATSRLTHRRVSTLKNTNVVSTFSLFWTMNRTVMRMMTPTATRRPTRRPSLSSLSSCRGTSLRPGS